MRQQLEGSAYRETVQAAFDHYPTMAEQHQQAYGFATTVTYRRSGASRNGRTAVLVDPTAGQDAFAALSQASSATATPTAGGGENAVFATPGGVTAVLEQQQELQGVVQTAQGTLVKQGAAAEAEQKPATTDRISLGKQLSRQASQRAAALAAKGRARLRRGGDGGRSTRYGGGGGTDVGITVGHCEQAT